MADKLYLDLETRSRCDLTKHGSYNYADDPSTKVLIWSYAINDQPVKRYEAWRGKTMPPRLALALTDKRVQVVAHGPFERIVLRKQGFDIALDRYIDTMAQARQSALPGGLGKIGPFLAERLPQHKDNTGGALIRAHSIPRKDGTFNDDPAGLTKFGEYCDQDVRTMRAFHLGFTPLTEEALATYRANEIVNDRGMPIDLELCEMALKYADIERDEANSEIVRLTNGEIKLARSPKVAEWVYARLEEEERAHMRRMKQRGVAAERGHRGKTEFKQHDDLALQGDEYESHSLDAAAREALIDALDLLPAEKTATLLAVIDAVERASSASVSKFKRMLEMASSDGRLRGAYVFNGASGSGRFSSKGAQTHNFPRLCAKDPEAVRKLMKRGADLGGPVLETLKSMLRPAIYPGRGKRIVRCDWNAVEARGLPWLADDSDARRYLQAFADKSRDIYMEQALASGLGENRQGGKVVVLSLGYLGGVGALAAMAKGYGVTLQTHPATVVKRWRQANQWALRLGYGLMDAAHNALADPGTRYKQGRLSFCTAGEFLTMKLPCGRELVYPFAANEEGNISYHKAAWSPKKTSTVWPRARLWPGLASENGTQAACGSLLRHALVRAVNDGLPIIGHVHDELVGEDSVKRAKALARELQKRMLASPAWADGLPLAAETDIAERFRK